jgi:hypothetical protein
VFISFGIQNKELVILCCPAHLLRVAPTLMATQRCYWQPRLTSYYVRSMTSGGDGTLVDSLSVLTLGRGDLGSLLTPGVRKAAISLRTLSLFSMSLPICCSNSVSSAWGTNQQKEQYPSWNDTP